MFMTPQVIRRIGGLFAILGLGYVVLFCIPLRFDPNPQHWFSPAYYTQFLPLYIAFVLFLSGVFVLTRFRQANLYLAIFGHTASEEVLFSWIGLTVSPLPLHAMLVFLPLSLFALWMGYANTLKQKRLSWGEAVFGILLSTSFVLAPRFL